MLNLVYLLTLIAFVLMLLRTFADLRSNVVQIVVIFSLIAAGMRIVF